MKKEEYKCEQCGQTFKKAWSDKEAQEEYEMTRNFEDFKNEPKAVICDDCYKIIMKTNIRRKE